MNFALIRSVILTCLMVVTGCNSNAPETESAGSKELRQASEQSRKNSKELERVKTELQAIDEWRHALSDGSQTTLKDLDAKLVRLERDIKELHDKLDRLPTPTKLQMKVPNAIQGTFEEAIAELSNVTTIAMRIESADLSEAKIPKIRFVDLPSGQTAQALLNRAVSEANLEAAPSLDDPKQMLVYVLHPLPGGNQDEVVVTTRRRAAERGQLPAVFGKAE